MFAIRSLLGRQELDPDVNAARRVFNLSASLIGQLPDGRWVMCDRVMSVYTVLEPPLNVFAAHQELLAMSTIAERLAVAPAPILSADALEI